MITYDCPALVPLARSMTAVAALAAAACTSDGYIGGSDRNNTAISLPVSCDGWLREGHCMAKGTHTLDGLVFDANAGPVADVSLNVYVYLPDGSGYSYWFATGSSFKANADGRFRATDLPDSRILLWVGGKQSEYLQPCAVSVDVQGDVTRDIEVVAVETLSSLAAPRPLTARGTTLTGTVYETTAAGRQPLADARIEVDQYDIPVAHTRTDLSGHYFFCDLPVKGLEIFFGKPGYASLSHVPGDAVPPTIDIELTRQ